MIENHVIFRLYAAVFPPAEPGTFLLTLPQRPLRR